MSDTTISKTLIDLEGTHGNSPMRSAIHNHARNRHPSSRHSRPFDSQTPDTGKVRSIGLYRGYRSQAEKRKGRDQRLLSVDFLAMTEADHQDTKPIILNLIDDAVIADSV